MNLWIYTGEQEQEYPDLKITATPGLFVELADRAVPKDGLWRAADVDEIAAHAEAAAINAAIEQPVSL